ncbi:MAG TPA: nitrate reductase associated protein [Parvibaculum sp.]
MMFNFEFDFAGNLQCIPMVVRFNLDRCGIKLSIEQWSCFTHKERVRLIEQLCDAHEDVLEYRHLLARLIRFHTGEEPDEIAIDEAPEWNDCSRVPLRLQAYADEKGLPMPSLAAWARLEPLQRFTLYKLTRPGHRNENFVPAFHEFNLTTGPLRRASRR